MSVGGGGGVRTHPLHPPPYGPDGLYSYTLVVEAMYGNGCSMYMYGIKPFMILTNIYRLFAMFTRLTTNSLNNFLYQEDQENSYI